MKSYPHIGFFLWLFVSCTSGDSNPRQLNSGDYENITERLEVLKKEVNCYSEILDTEFQLFNVNGFKNERVTVPGATSLDYKFVVRIDTSKMKEWTKDMIEFIPQKIDLKWMKKITAHQPENWNTKSVPKFYHYGDDKVLVVAYIKEGIIFKRVLKL